MKNMFYCGLLCTSLFFSCTQNPKVALEEKKSNPTPVESLKPADTKLGLPLQPVESILKNFNSFWAYYTQNVELFQDFTPLNAKGELISKQSFLTQMSSGRYFPLVINAKADEHIYRLEKINPKADSFIGAYMEQFSKEELKFHQLRGKPVPNFSFTDVNGKIYTPANTKGKIVLLKCWFIGCVACVKEMPDLNAMVKKYQDRADILFISLASDSKKELQQFLTKVAFDYATVPNQGKYMSDQLNVAAYPTHFLINKEGIVVDVLPDGVQIAKALSKALEKAK
ncbi:TlpA disulfide reductase family protein [Pedobacter sp. Hv1]|uniref:TlpA family protein disulfide reductase n=1 Tax=Pedobacter sp. Hv1 TaxID=1740090 RepID=UPI0006D8ABA3|nr:TlpA disulfide reductase family protein [Pedobacter sp. Hv1]KQC02223.1 hypothetical protein AQF98_01210 [Pedobacter sp. Hv1]